ncbi:MAG: asparagine synthase-related protein [Sulfurimonas sp.]
MSGFITIYNTDGKPVDKQLIHSLTETLKFRGPDQQKVWIDGNIGMGHALFKTTFEAEYENQPATIDNKVWITCSARIDDRKNLVNKMGLKQSLELSRTPDSELILHAYRKWGEACLDHLLGDFAFVIWDKDKQKLFAAKDRFGMRQLYYAKKGKSIIISNTFDAIKQSPSISNTLNQKAVAGFLLFGDHTWLDKSITVLKDITSLLPAHSLTAQNNLITIKKYWDIPLELPLLRYKKDYEYIDHFLEVFKTAIKDRIRTNSLTISLSGGMDSSSIAATVRLLEKEKKVDTLNLHAVTAVYDRIIPCQERYFSGIVSKHLKIPIHYMAGDDYPFMKPIVLTTRPLEIDTFSFWKDVKKDFAKHSRVVMTGAAADNLLTYSPAITTFKEINPFKVIADIYQLSKRYHRRPPIGTGLMSALRRRSHKKENIEPYPFPDYFDIEFEKTMGLKEMWDSALSWKPETLHARHPTAQTALLDAYWNRDDIIMESEFTLAEERDPFLDLRLIEFLFAIPSLPWFFHKHILREAMAELLPQEILTRPKTGLGNIQQGFMQEPSSSWINKWEPSQNLSDYLNKDKAMNYLRREDPDLNYLGLRAITLEMWLSAFRHSIN